MQSASITANVVSSGEVYSPIQHYVIKFVSYVYEVKNKKKLCGGTKKKEE